MVEHKLRIVFRGIVYNDYLKLGVVLAEQCREVILQILALVFGAHHNGNTWLLLFFGLFRSQLQSRFPSSFLGSLPRFARLSFLPFGVPAKTLFLLMPYAPLYARHVTYVEIQLIHEHQR